MTDLIALAQVAQPLVNLAMLGFALWWGVRTERRLDRIEAECANRPWSRCKPFPRSER
jgi:hypothetical protein